MTPHHFLSSPDEQQGNGKDALQATGALLINSANLHGYAAISNSPVEPTKPAAVSARLVSRWGSLQAGVDLRGLPLDTLSNTATNRVDLWQHLDVRAVYSETWRHPVTRQPESLQVEMTLRDAADTLTCSVFRHETCRVNALPFCYWKNSALAAQVEARGVSQWPSKTLVDED